MCPLTLFLKEIVMNLLGEYNMYEVITAQENGEYYTEIQESYEAALEHYMYLRDGGTHLISV